MHHWGYCFPVPSLYVDPCTTGDTFCGTDTQSFQSGNVGPLKDDEAQLTGRDLQKLRTHAVSSQCAFRVVLPDGARGYLRPQPACCAAAWSSVPALGAGCLPGSPAHPGRPQQPLPEKAAGKPRSSSPALTAAGGPQSPCPPRRSLPQMPAHSLQQKAHHVLKLSLHHLT